MKTLMGFICCLLVGCASVPAELSSPCKEFGRYCPQQPINQEGL